MSILHALTQITNGGSELYHRRRTLQTASHTVSLAARLSSVTLLYIFCYSDALMFHVFAIQHLYHTLSAYDFHCTANLLSDYIAILLCSYASFQLLLVQLLTICLCFFPSPSFCLYFCFLFHSFCIYTYTLHLWVISSTAIYISLSHLDIFTRKYIDIRIQTHINIHILVHITPLHIYLKIY
jgi:hypothetical protein